jgi:PEP-CTERM motif
MRLQVSLFALGIACASLLSPLSARAEILNEGRLSAYTITFSNPNFSDANAFYQVTSQIVSTNPPETISGYNPSLKTDHNSLIETGTGGVTVSNLVDHGGFATFNLSSNGTPGTWIQSYNTPVQSAFNPGSGFGNTWIITNNFGSHTGLEFGGGNGGGSGLVNNGFPFAIDVLINGNWSSQGTGVGQLQLVSFNSSWTVDDDFTYNSITNMTDFHAHIDAYTGPGSQAGGDPGLDFILHGSAPAVPEPSSFILMLGLTGLAGLVGLRRRFRNSAR